MLQLVLRKRQKHWAVVQRYLKCHARELITVQLLKIPCRSILHFIWNGWIVQLLWNTGKKSLQISLLVPFRCCKFNGSENSIRCEKIVCNSKCLMTMRFNLKCRVFGVSIEQNKKRRIASSISTCVESSVAAHVSGCLYDKMQKLDVLYGWRMQLLEEASSERMIFDEYSTWIVDEKMLQLNILQVVQSFSHRFIVVVAVSKRVLCYRQRNCWQGIPTKNR